MRGTKRAALVTAVAAVACASAAFGIAALHAPAATAAAAPAAASASCQQDGVVALCVTPTPSGDALALRYQVTQTDGPGTYSLYSVNTRTGVASSPRTVGPLGYQQVVTGTMYTAIGSCYDVHLDGVPGQSVVVASVCG